MLALIKQQLCVVLKNPLAYLFPVLLTVMLVLPAVAGQFSLCGSQLLDYFNPDQLAQAKANLEAFRANGESEALVATAEQQVDALTRAVHAPSRDEKIQAGADFWRAVKAQSDLGFYGDYLGAEANALAFIRPAESDPTFFDEASSLPVFPFVAAVYPLVPVALWAAPTLMAGCLAVASLRKGALLVQAPLAPWKEALAVFCSTALSGSLLAGLFLGCSLLLVGLRNGWEHAEYPVVWIQGDSLAEATASQVVVRLLLWLLLLNLFLAAVAALVQGLSGGPVVVATTGVVLVLLASASAFFGELSTLSPLRYFDPRLVVGLLSYANGESLAPVGVTFAGCATVLGVAAFIGVVGSMGAAAPRRSVRC